MTEDQRKFAQAEIERITAALNSEPPLLGRLALGVFTRVHNLVFPGVGTAITTFHKWLGCPPLEIYRDELQAFLDGRRDSLPSEPDLRKYYVPR